MIRSVFVTGAANGTGYAIAERFAREGWAVFIGSRSEESAREAAERLGKEYGVLTHGYGTKVGDEEDVRRIFADIKARGCYASALVLNAANLGIGQDTLTVELADFRAVYETNVFWNYMLVRAAAEGMIENGGGSVVFITSNTAYRAVHNRVAYSSSKSAILGMARSLAFDLGKYNIRVNSVLPGMIKTERWLNNLNGTRDSIYNCTPLGDIAEFTDVANAAWYLGSDEARNTTGAELSVDGGNLIQLMPDLDGRGRK